MRTKKKVVKSIRIATMGEMEDFDAFILKQMRKRLDYLVKHLAPTIKKVLKAKQK